MHGGVDVCQWMDGGMRLDVQLLHAALSKSAHSRGAEAVGCRAAKMHRSEKYAGPRVRPQVTLADSLGLPLPLPSSHSHPHRRRPSVQHIH